MSESLLPREHGAYAQLTFPILSGLLLGRPGAESFGFAIAAIFLFLAHEPVLILTGVRGPRRRRELGGAARTRLILLLPAGLIAGGGAMTLAGAATRLLALIPGALALVLVPIVLTHREKSIPGEFLVAAAMASLHLVIGSGGGLKGVALWGPGLLWFVFYAVATLAVHAVRAGGGFLRTLSLLAALTACAGSIALIMMPAGYRWLGAAALFPALTLFVVNVSGVSVRRLKQVGWTIVAGQVVALCTLLLSPGRPG